MERNHTDLPSNNKLATFANAQGPRQPAFVRWSAFLIFGLSQMRPTSVTLKQKVVSLCGNVNESRAGYEVFSKNKTVRQGLSFASGLSCRIRRMFRGSHELRTHWLFYALRDDFIYMCTRLVVQV